MRTTTFLFIAAMGLVLTAFPAAAQVDVTYSCSATPTGSVEWPAGNPIWTFDFVRPSNSSGGDGSGLELRDVYYDGHLVFKRAHTPILNVEYDPGGCGCFRDWSFSEANMEADGVQTGSCVALSTPGTVRTTCDTGVGGTPGSFKGVAFEEYKDELVLTTHMSAGWYRYRMKWHFYLDGRIWPEYSFAANDATCTSVTHRHHVYWRFDFDLDGPANDAVTEVNPVQDTSTLITTEDDRTWGNGTDGIYWLVEDQVTGAAYRIVPSAADLLLPVDPFSIADAIVLRYNASEIHDGSASCAINFNSEINGEDVNGQDIVFWYRAGASHTGGSGFDCDIVGPMLSPDSNPPPTDLAVTCTPVSPPVVIPAGGGSYAYDIQIVNNGASAETFDIWLDMDGPGVDRTRGPSTRTLAAGASLSRTLNQNIPGGAPAGDYTHTCNIGTFPLPDDSDSFDFTKSEVFVPGGVSVADWTTDVEFAAMLGESSTREELPSNYALEGSYPNPFNPATTIRFSLPESAQVRLVVYDVLGRQVRVLADGTYEAGTHEVVFDADGLPSGTYLYRLETPQGSFVRTMLLAK